MHDESREASNGQVGMRRRTREAVNAVRDLPEPKPKKLTQEDLRILRKSGFKKLARLTERYAVR